MEDLAKDEPDGWVAKALAEAPQKPEFAVEPWHDAYWQAWHALRYDRAYVGMTGAEMPISFVSIDAYARRYGMQGDSFDRLLRFVSAIDFAYLDLRNKPPSGVPSPQANNKPVENSNG